MPSYDPFLPVSGVSGRLGNSSNVRVQEFLSLFQLQKITDRGKIEPTDRTEAETKAPSRGLERMGHCSRFEQAEAPGKIAVHRLDGSRLVNKKQRKARLFERWPIGERLVDTGIQLGAEGDRHQGMFDR